MPTVPGVESTAINLAAVIDWVYVSGFLDGEGGITINCNLLGRVIHIEMSMGQKSSEVLELIADFLERHGIRSAILGQSDGTHHLRISRISDTIQMAANMKLVVKARQVRAASDYLRGKLTGNQFLAILQDEFLNGRRKARIPGEAFKFPLTRFQAKKIGLENASAA